MTAAFDPLTIFVITWGSIILAIFAILYFLITHCLYQERHRPHHLTPHTIHLITLNTCIGCSDGYCYLDMFRPMYQAQICTRLGAYPTILDLLSIPTSWRTVRRGSLEFMSTNLWHYEQGGGGEKVWEILESTFLYRNEIAHSIRTILDSPLPDGYRYLHFILPSYHQAIASIYGPNPSIAVLNSTPTHCRTPARGDIREVEANLLQYVYHSKMDAWYMVQLWSEMRPGARIGI